MTDCCATPGLMPIAAGRARLLALARPPADRETVPLLAAAGRVLAADCRSRVDVPPADNSAMDGYAFRLADLQAAGGSLPVSQRIPAGSAPSPLLPATAARIFTGAEVPPGADTVVMQEDCRQDAGQVVVAAAALAGLKAGANVRPRGQDIGSGAVVVAAGTRLAPAQLGVLAAAGVGSVPVYRRVRVALFSTGDELLEPDEPPAPGRIYNSNRYALHAWLTQAGCEVIDLGVIGDALAATRAALLAAGDQADLVLTTGGASVGEEDHLGTALAAVGEVDLWKIAIKPGKPLLFGRITRAGGATPVLGLPGNPVSVAVTFLLFGMPFLRALQGAQAAPATPWRVAAGFAVRKAGSREEYLRVRCVAGPDGPVLERFPNQSSGVLMSVAWADGLARVPPGVTVAPGDLLDYLPWADLMA